MKYLLEAILRQLRLNNEIVLELTRNIKALHPEVTEPNTSTYDDEVELEEPPDIDIELGTRDVLRLLQISESTLTRWRSQGVVQFRYLSSNHVAYLYSKLYNAVKSGKATCKGFSKVKALQRLDDYMSNLEALRDEDAHFQPQRL